MPDSEFDRKVIHRDVARKLLTVDLGVIDSTMQDESKVNSDVVHKMLGRLKAHKVELSELDGYILTNVTEPHCGDEVAKVYEYRVSLSEAVSFLEGRPKHFESMQTPSTSTHCTADQLNERVPVMELTEFDGNPLNFEEFWDDFTTSVDQRADISTITKFKLLRKCLVGKAAATCKGYQLTTANYGNVKSILEQRYGDKETAIALHLDALIRLEPAVSDAISELSRIRDQCEVHIRALVILGFGDDAFGPLFAPIVLSKLPSTVRLEVRRQKKCSGDAKWTMKRLRELLSTEIELRASNECEFFGPCDKNTSPESQQTAKSPDTALFLNSSGQLTVTCAFCDGSHYSANCEAYPDVSSRHSRMGNRCFLCLRRGHRKADCRANRKPCFYCRKRDHHCSLCLRKFGSPSELAFAASQTPSTSYEPQNFLRETICTANSRPSATDKSGMAILETAVTTVSGTTGTCQGRIVLDCGSTKFFMSAQLVRRIGARLVGHDTPAIGRFGETARVHKQLPRHEFSIGLRDGRQRLVQMNAEDSLAPSITLQPFDMNVIQGYFKANELAEVNVCKPTEAEIDILIGLDNYYSFVNQGEARVDGGLVLKDSTLGVIVTGCTQPATACQNTVCWERSQPSAFSTNCGAPTTKLGPLDLSKPTLMN